MDYDKMVSLIVEEVLDKLKETPTINNHKKKAIVFQNGNLQWVYNFLGKEFEFISYDTSIREGDALIIPKLTLTMMANLANLNPSKDEETFILEMLMKGKKIYIFEEGLEYRRYKDTAPKQLYNKFLNFEKQLLNYGIEILNENLNVPSYHKEILSEQPVEIIKGEKISKKVITEGDVRKLHEKGENIIMLGEKTILTPLAKDFVKMNHMEIVKGNG